MLPLQKPGFSEKHRPHALAPIGWLLLLHVLADLAVALYRCVNLDAALTDLLAAELPRSQLCLLAIWLALGREPLSWRICGLLAGTSLMFTLFTRLLFPGRLGSDPADYWFKEEWGYFFRHSGPGDLLAGAPALVLLVVIPLLLWRGGHGIRAWHVAPGSWRQLLRRVRLQFGFRDLAIWVVAICTTLVAAFQTAPYAGWFEQLRETWPACYSGWRWWLVQSPALGLPYAVSAFGVLWAVFSERRLPLRIAVAALVVTAALVGYDFAWQWLPWDAALPNVGRPASASLAALLLATLTTAGSLLLFRSYRRAASFSP